MTVSIKEEKKLVFWSGQMQVLVLPPSQPVFLSNAIKLDLASRGFCKCSQSITINNIFIEDYFFFFMKKAYFFFVGLLDMDLF